MVPAEPEVDDGAGGQPADGAWDEKAMYGKTYLGVILSYFVSDDARRVAGAQIKISSSASVSRAAAAPEA